MDINEIIDYVLNTPGNTNAAILKSMIETYVAEHGSGDMPPSGSDVTYDGGEEV